MTVLNICMDISTVSIKHCGAVAARLAAGTCALLPAVQRKLGQLGQNNHLTHKISLQKNCVVERYLDSILPVSRVG